MRKISPRGIPSIKFSADERMRKEMNARNCDWEIVQEVPVVSIDANDNEFQTRLDCHTADKELVAKYVEAMAAGDVFPEIVLAAQKRHKHSGPVSYSIVCGKHRVLALRESGFESCNALLMWIASDDDRKKARDLSSHDNYANGKATSREVMYEQLAQECISENGGYVEGLPPPAIISQIVNRHSIKKPDLLRLHVHRLLFQHECRNRKLIAPEGVEVCSAAYAFSDKEGFSELIHAVSAARETKGLAQILKDGKRRKKSGSVVASLVNDASSGYSVPAASGIKMTLSSRVVLNCEQLRKLLVSKLADDKSVGERDCEDIEAALEKLCESGANVVHTIRKKVRGA
jgi:hypothetical protein